MTDLSRLADLAKRYRAFATSARLSAATSDGKMRDQFIDIAEHWERLALEAEDMAGAGES